MTIDSSSQADVICASPCLLSPADISSVHLSLSHSSPVEWQAFAQLLPAAGELAIARALSLRLMLASALSAACIALKRAAKQLVTREEMCIVDTFKCMHVNN